MLDTTLCYIEKDSKYLMLHRVKKDKDINKGKWIGVGGKFEEGETADECVVREVFEETGLVVQPEDFEYRGIVTFVDTSSEPVYTEFMHIFRTQRFEGNLKTDCDEGNLEWVPVEKLNTLPHWQGDEIFLDFIAQGRPFFSLKLIYKNNVLIQTYLDGKEYKHFI